METGKKKQRRTRGALTHEYTEEEWNRVLAVNLTGVWLCMKAEITPMLKQGGGAIVNTSSIMHGTHWRDPGSCVHRGKTWGGGDHQGGGA